MMVKQIELKLPEPDKWTRPKGAHGCGRIPDAGPGTCWYWWDGCPGAKARGCFQLWVKRQSHAEGGKDGAR